MQTESDASILPQWNVPEGEAGRRAVLPTDLQITWTRSDGSQVNPGPNGRIYVFADGSVQYTCEIQGKANGRPVTRTATITVVGMPRYRDTESLLTTVPAGGTSSDPAEYTVLKGAPVGFVSDWMGRESDVRDNLDAH